MRAKASPRSWRSDHPSRSALSVLPGPRRRSSRPSGGVGVATDLLAVDIGNAFLRLEAAERRLTCLRDADLVRLARADRELVSRRAPQREPTQLSDDGLPVHRDLHRSPELVPREGDVVTLGLPHFEIEIQVPLEH